MSAQDYVSLLERCCAEALKELNDAREAEPALLADAHVTLARAWLCRVADAIPHAPPDVLPGGREGER